MNCKVCSRECLEITKFGGTSHYEQCPTCKLYYLVEGNNCMNVPSYLVISHIDNDDSRVLSVTVDNNKVKIIYDREE